MPTIGLQSIYVELIDQLKIKRVRNLILTNNGFGKGDFDLSSYKLTGGKYQLRAYSTYQRNFGDDFLFSKNILLAELYQGQVLPIEGENPKDQKGKSFIDQVQKLQDSGSLDLQFLPEGGYLSVGCSCRMAFIARDTNNKPQAVSG